MPTCTLCWISVNIVFVAKHMTKDESMYAKTILIPSFTLFLVSGDICRMLITFANSLDPDQNQQALSFTYRMFFSTRFKVTQHHCKLKWAHLSDMGGKKFIILKRVESSLGAYNGMCRRLVFNPLETENPKTGNLASSEITRHFTRVCSVCPDNILFCNP